MIFRRAMIAELSGTAGAVFTVLFCIVFTQGLVRILGDAASGDVDSKAVFSIVALTALTSLPLVLALTVFIAVLMALSRAFRDSEMVVWFASGQSLFAWVRPVLRFAAPLAVVVAMLSLAVAPWAERMIAEGRQRFEQRDDVSKVTPGRFVESSASERVFFVENLDLDGARVKNVFVSHRNGDRDNLIVAAQGVIETHADGSRFLVLENGRRYEGTPGVAEYRVLEFDRYAIRLEPQTETPVAPSLARALPTAQLVAEPSARNLGELLWRIGLPALTLVLALLAIPLAYTNPRIGRSANLIAAVLVFLLYVNGVQIMMAWVQRERVGFATAVWLTHAVALAATASLFVRRIYMQRWLPRWLSVGWWRHRRG
ncbi:MAG TPA: LPS export ABC transporter permease LptF [Burkholderiaceae bacterium]